MIRPEDNPKVIMAGLTVIATLVTFSQISAANADMVKQPGVATVGAPTPSAYPTVTVVKEPSIDQLASENSKKLSTTKYNGKDALTPRELQLLLYKVGFRGQNLKEAWCIAMRESSGRPMAHNTNASTGDNSYGLFQINMIGSLGTDRQDKYGLKTYNDLFDPVTNAEIAFQMSNGGDNWSAWKGMNAGARQWLDNYPGNVN